MEWSSFNEVSVNEEVDFMAKLFPNSSISNKLEMSSSLSLSSSFHSGHGSFNSNNTNSNLYSLFQESCLSERSDNVDYNCNEVYFLSDPDQFLAVNDGGTLPVGFCLDTKGCIQVFPGEIMERRHGPSLEMSCDNSEGLKKGFTQSQCSELDTKPDKTEIESVEEDKSDDSLEHGRKRSQNYEVEKGKRNLRSRKKRKLGSEDEDSSHNVKTRVSRGSAIDPQSLYARKRRERINERLRILQTLIPNGTKVDISTMLEEAVHYVKFLELQIKLLSSDELWMYAPLAYNGMDIGLDSKINSLL